MEVYAKDLEISGFEVLFKSDVDEALTFLKQEPDTISLLILDLMLPPGKSFKDEDTNEGLRTGINFYRRVRSILPATPVVILTNVSDEKVEDWFQDKVNCWFFQKKDLFPFELTEVIKKILSQSRKEMSIHK
jgi:CheY-like chemotaxis protein